MIIPSIVWCALQVCGVCVWAHCSAWRSRGRNNPTPTPRTLHRWTERRCLLRESAVRRLKKKQHTNMVRICRIWKGHHTGQSVQHTVPALAPKSLSKPGPTADAFIPDTSDRHSMYSHSISALSGTCTPTIGFKSASISKVVLWRMWPTWSVCTNEESSSQWL